MMTKEDLLLSEHAYMAELFDRMAIADTIQRERAARNSPHETKWRPTTIRTLQSRLRGSEATVLNLWR